jgi:hypothetical protein
MQRYSRPVSVLGDADRPARLFKFQTLHLYLLVPTRTTLPTRCISVSPNPYVPGVPIELPPRISSRRERGGGKPRQPTLAGPRRAGGVSPVSLIIERHLKWGRAPYLYQVLHSTLT